MAYLPVIAHNADSSIWIGVVVVSFLIGWLVWRAVKDEKQRMRGVIPPKSKGYIDVQGAIARWRYSHLAFQIIFVIAMACLGIWESISFERDIRELQAGEVPSLKVHRIIAWAYNSFGADGAIFVNCTIWVLGIVVACVGIGEAFQKLQNRPKQQSAPDEKH